MTAKVSICIPTYNGESYLEDALNSVLNQSYDNFEVIIVDDQSTDNTVDISKKFSDKDQRIHCYQNKKNLGLVSNWNRCIELAQGEWIKFVFQDDIIRSDCLEIMMKGASQNEPLIFCHRNFFFDSETDDATKNYYMTLPGFDEIFPGINLISHSKICHAVLTNSQNFFGEPTSTLIHRSVFERFGLFNPAMVQICDLEYWIRVSVNTGGKYISDPLVQFRVHTSSTSSKNRDSQAYRSDHMDRLILLHEFAYNPFYEPLRKYIKKNYPTRSFKKELAKRAFWLKNLANASSWSENNQLTPKEHWAIVAKIYPKINSSFYLIPYKARNWLNKQLLWRFNKI